MIEFGRTFCGSNFDLFLKLTECKQKCTFTQFFRLCTCLLKVELQYLSNTIRFWHTTSQNAFVVSHRPVGARVFAPTGTILANRVSTSTGKGPAIWLGEWVAGPAVTTGAEDVAQWPYTPGLLVKWPSSVSLHWPAGSVDLGVGGISYVKLLILYELWAGERLTLEKAHPRCLRPGRPISVSAVPFGPGIDIWRSCRFVGAMMRSPGMLPGGLGGFVPCSTNH